MKLKGLALLKVLSNRKNILNVYTTGATMLGEYLVRGALNKTWKLIKRSDPPLDAGSLKTPWKDAIIWTALYSLAGGMAGLLSRRLARISFNRMVSI